MEKEKFHKDAKKPETTSDDEDELFFKLQ